MAVIGNAFDHRFALGVFLLLASSFAQCAQDDEPPQRPGIPIVGRPTTDFYNAAGTGIKLKVEADPTEVPGNQWLTFTLTISKLLNPIDVTKPSLKELPDFASFQIDERKELDPPIDPAKPDQRVFVYKLRPNSETVERIPAIGFVYYDPRRIVAPNRPQDKFPKVMSNTVAIHVMPPTPLATSRVPLEIPPFAEKQPVVSYSSADSFTEAHRQVLGWWMLLAAPLAAVGWVIAWRRLYPDEARLGRLRRNLAFRRALDALRAADDAASGAIVLQYLQSRFSVPEFATTPREISAHLHLEPSRCDETVAFLRSCDEARYAPLSASSQGLSARGRCLVIMLEEST